MNTIFLPKLIDCHVHFREPGFPNKATMATEAASAKAGGVYTVCEMPNTIPTTNSIEALRDKIDRADKVRESLGVDIRFFFNIGEQKHMDDLERIWTEDSPEMKRLKHGCVGIKLFLENSTGDLKTDEDLVPSVFEFAARLGISITAHCEDATMNAEAKQLAEKTCDTPFDIAMHSTIRPAESEGASVAYAMNLVRTYGTKFHVAHLSTFYGLEEVRKAKAEGLPVTCEVAPHHLFLTTHDYVDMGVFCKMNPPVRSKDHRDALWKGVLDGTIDCISTDHAPHTLKEKESPENPLDSPSGVPGVETMVPLLLTVATGTWPHPTGDAPDTDGFGVEDIKRLCFTNPNTIYNLEKDETDTIEFDISNQWQISSADLHSKCTWTPYEGWSVVGRVV